MEIIRLQYFKNLTKISFKMFITFKITIVLQVLWEKLNLMIKKKLC